MPHPGEVLGQVFDLLHGIADILQRRSEFFAGGVELMTEFAILCLCRLQFREPVFECGNIGETCLEGTPDVVHFMAGVIEL